MIRFAHIDSSIWIRTGEDRLVKCPSCLEERWAEGGIPISPLQALTFVPKLQKDMSIWRWLTTIRPNHPHVNITVRACRGCGLVQMSVDPGELNALVGPE